MPVNALKKQKKALFKNIFILRKALDNFTQSGFLDFDSIFYNQLEALEEEMHASLDINELKELVTQARLLEKQLCSLYDRVGLSTVSLDWPDFE